MLLSEKDIKIIQEHYPARGHNNNLAEDDLGFGFIHYAMIRNLKPDNILVVGSQRGYVPVICALAAKHNGFGMVHFVDAGFDQAVPEDNQTEGEKSWGGIGIWKTATADYWKPLDVQDYITLHNMTTEEYAEKNKTLLYGYAYIDGDHSFEGVKRDFLIFRPNMQEGGIMTFHDVCVDKQTAWGECGVKRFWDELQNKRLTVNKDCGLGIMQL